MTQTVSSEVEQGTLNSKAIGSNPIRSTKKAKDKEEKIKSAPFDTLFHSEKRIRILNEQKGKCLWCQNFEWLGKPIKLELDHIDGNKYNETRENLRFLCPNCHSMTPTYKVGNNKFPGYTRVSNTDIIIALTNNDSAYHAMKSLNMNPHGGNYVRLRKIIKDHNIILPYNV